MSGYEYFSCLRCLMSFEKKSLKTFSFLAGMDIMARTGYQMGKSPLLPLFAVSLGADTKEVGWVVGVSVLTGMFFKPLVGRVSDRVGRKPLLLAGTLIFALAPIMYQCISTPAQLVSLRFFHGFATAIYGPVMAAMVVDIFPERGTRARALGWYDFFRSVGYVLGPFFGGLALTYFVDARTAYLLVGLTGLLAFIPALMLAEPAATSLPAGRESRPQAIGAVLRRLFASPLVARAIVVEIMAHMVIRMIKPFWTIYAVVTFTPYQVGAILSVIFAASLVMKPVSGMVTARFGHVFCLIGGAFFIGLGTPLLFAASHSWPLSVAAAVMLGVGDGFIMPAVLHLLSVYSPDNGKGLTMGILGSCRNFGKAMGPILAGYAIAWIGELITAYLFGAVLIVMTLCLVFVFLRGEGVTVVRC